MFVIKSLRQGAPQVVLVVENPPASEGDVGLSPGREEPPEEEMATHSSILAWDGLQRMGLQRVGRD